jgi:hypothetical protein
MEADGLKGVAEVDVEKLDDDDDSVPEITKEGSKKYSVVALPVTCQRDTS